MSCSHTCPPNASASTGLTPDLALRAIAQGPPNTSSPGHPQVVANSPVTPGGASAPVEVPVASKLWRVVPHLKGTGRRPGLGSKTWSVLCQDHSLNSGHIPRIHNREVTCGHQAPNCTGSLAGESHRLNNIASGTSMTSEPDSGAEKDLPISVSVQAKQSKPTNPTSETILLARVTAYCTAVIAFATVVGVAFALISLRTANASLQKEHKLQMQHSTIGLLSEWNQSASVYARKVKNNRRAFIEELVKKEARLIDQINQRIAEIIKSSQNAGKPTNEREQAWLAQLASQEIESRLFDDIKLQLEQVTGNSECKLTRLEALALWFADGAAQFEHIDTFRISCVELLNYFEYVAAGYVHDVFDKEIIDKALKPSMIRWCEILEEFMNMSEARRAVNSWEVLDELLADWKQNEPS
jgi:hypothetical protein